MTALFSLSCLKDEKLILKKQTYMKTEAQNLYSRVFWTLRPNVIEIDRIILSYTVSNLARFLRHSVYDEFTIIEHRESFAITKHCTSYAASSLVDKSSENKQLIINSLYKKHLELANRKSVA